MFFNSPEKEEKGHFRASAATEYHPALRCASIYKGGAEFSAFRVFLVCIAPKTGFFDLIWLLIVACLSVDYKENALPCKKVYRRRAKRRVLCLLLPFIADLFGTRFYNNAAKILGTEGILCRGFAKTGFFEAVLLDVVLCISVTYKENALSCKKVRLCR